MSLAELQQAAFPYVLGGFVAAALAYAAVRMRSDERWLLTWVMAVVVGGFVTFPLFAGDVGGTLAEGAVLLALGALLALSWHRQSAALLAAVYFGHGAWDLAHLVSDVSVSNPRWVHEFCVPFDWLLGAYILVRMKAWR